MTVEPSGQRSNVVEDFLRQGTLRGGLLVRDATPRTPGEELALLAVEQFQQHGIAQAG